MGLTRQLSPPGLKPGDAAIVAEIRAITVEFEGIACFIEAYNTRRVLSALGYLSLAKFDERHAPAMVKEAA